MSIKHDPILLNVAACCNQPFGYAQKCGFGPWGPESGGKGLRLRVMDAIFTLLLRADPLLQFSSDRIPHV